MPEYNPYEAPKTPVAPPPQRISTFMVAGVCVIAFLVAATYLPVLFKLVSTGALHPLAGMCTALAAFLVLVGAALVALRKRRAAAYVLGIALAFAIGGTFFWLSLISLAFVVLSAIGFGLSLRR